MYWVQGLRPSILAVTSTYMPHAYTFGFYLSHNVTCHFFTYQDILGRKSHLVRAYLDALTIALEKTG